MEARVVSLQVLLRQTCCGNIDIGLQSRKCDLQETLIYVLWQVYVFLMFLCVHQVFIQFVHINDLIDDNIEATHETVRIHMVCARVRQGVFCVLFLLLTGFRQISDCFKWARKVQSVEMYIIAISLVVD